MTMRLRYTGVVPVSLMGVGVELQPDSDMDFSDEMAQSLLLRSDFSPAPAESTDPEPSSDAAPQEAVEAPESTVKAASKGRAAGTDTNAC